tara:strand:+ start:118 stop:363 length:246 start_codon:yes stop_codon:yes gene_type:complete
MKKQQVKWFWQKNETPNHKTYDVDLLSEVIEMVVSERLDALGKELREDRSDRYCPACYIRDITKEITDEINEFLEHSGTKQ